MLFGGIATEAAHYWCNERLQRGVDWRVSLVLDWLFTVLDSLYLVVQRSSWTWEGKHEVRIDSLHIFILSIDMDLKDYTNFRAAVSLIGDIYNLLEPIKKWNLMEIKSGVEALVKGANRFRLIRNFFTHTGEPLTNLKKHGITGATKTGCDIEYLPNARECFHLVFEGSKVYFSYKGKAHEADFSITNFEEIFKAARSIYAELIKHEIHGNRDYPQPEMLYII